MMIGSKVVRSANISQKISRLHLEKLTCGMIGSILVYSCHNLHPNLIVRSLKLKLVRVTLKSSSELRVRFYSLERSSPLLDIGHKTWDIGHRTYEI